MRKLALVFCSFFALSIFGTSFAYAERFRIVRTKAVEVIDENSRKLVIAVHGSLSGGYTCATLENGNGRHLIPAGDYDIGFRDSPKFGKDWPEILVSGREYIHFHAGNYPSHSTGCVLLGDYEKDGVLGNPRHHVGNFVNLVRRDRDRGISSTVEIIDVYNFTPAPVWAREAIRPPYPHRPYDYDGSDFSISLGRCTLI